MRTLYHASLSSHQEVMYRDEADLNRGFNYLAEACLETESSLLAESFLSTHHHAMVFTDRIKELLHIHRYSYTRYFNARYGRKSRLGENRPFILPIEGFYHITVALNYVLRQGLHHGITATAFGYPHCTVNALFMKELGRHSPQALMPDGQRYKYLPDRSSMPDSIRMNTAGLLLREDVIDTSHVETIYVSPRNFIFQMNKLSDQKWIDEQKTDKSETPVITLELIETGVNETAVSQLLINEKQGRINPNRLTDLDLCRIIDNDYLPKMMGCQNQSPSIYGLSPSERANLGNKLWQEIPKIYQKTVTTQQLRRCICLDY